MGAVPSVVDSEMNARASAILSTLVLSDRSVKRETGWTLTAVGDFVIHGSAVPLEPGRYVDRELADAVGASDLSLVNFEGSIRRGEGAIAKIGPAISMHPEVPSLLKEAGFRVASLANNHAMDFGPSALARSAGACRAAGLLTCGGGATESEAFAPAEVVAAGKLKVAVVSLCEREFGVAHGSEAGTAWISSPHAVPSIAAARVRADVVVAVAHGGVEFAPFSPAQRASQLRRLVDAGADVVIGHHPHVAQGWEVYRGVPIFHSLGNFVFEFDGCRRRGTEWGLMVQLKMSDRVGSPGTELEFAL